MPLVGASSPLIIVTFFPEPLMTDTTPDFRALCAELTKALDAELDLFETRHSELLERARAALEATELKGTN